MCSLEWCIDNTKYIYMYAHNSIYKGYTKKEHNFSTYYYTFKYLVSHNS